MTCRQPVPRLWLVTDERLGDALWRAVRRLPRGAGIVLRHHATPAPERAQLRRRLARLARARGLVLVEHGRALDRRRGLPLTWPAHDRREAVTGLRAGAALLFVSPVFPTRTHPGASALGPRRAALIGRGLPILRIALGGVDARRFRLIERSGFDGWAAIDAWLPRQKRKAVPT